MSTQQRTPGISAQISYESRMHEAGGGIVDGELNRIGDEFVTRSDLLRFQTSLKAKKHLSVEISNPTGLPNYLATLALAEPDEDEDVGNFSRRLALRDELAEAFEKAAARLRQAPRR